MRKFGAVMVISISGEWWPLCLRKWRLFSSHRKWKVPDQPKRQPLFQIKPPINARGKCVVTWGNRAEWKVANTELASPWEVEAVDPVAECILWCHMAWGHIWALKIITYMTLWSLIFFKSLFMLHFPLLQNEDNNNTYFTDIYADKSKYR